MTHSFPTRGSSDLSDMGAPKGKDGDDALVTVASLVSKVARFAGCGMATQGMAAQIAKTSGKPAKTIEDELKANLIPGALVAGMIAVLVAALMADRRFRQAVIEEAVELEPNGSIRLVMTDAVDGPVAFGLWRRFVAEIGRAHV